MKQYENSKKDAVRVRERRTGILGEKPFLLDLKPAGSNCSFEKRWREARTLVDRALLSPRFHLWHHINWAAYVILALGRQQNQKVENEAWR